MRKIEKTIVTTTILLLALVPLASIVSSAGPNYMGFDTANPHVTVTDSFDVIAWVDVDSKIDTAAIDNLTYLPAGRLHYTSTAQGDDLFPGTTMWLTPTVIDDTKGYVKPIVWSYTAGVDDVVNETLATITWYANSCGEVTLTIAKGGTALIGVDPGTTKLPYTIYVHPKAPTDFSATYVSENHIDLTWTKQTGMDRTLIRWKTNVYPTNVTDGNELYNDTGDSKSHTGLNLNPGDQIFYSAWGWNDTEQLYSLNYATTLGGNLPPYMPSSPSPSNGATGVGINADLNWTGGDPDPADTVTYDVYFGTSSTPPKVVSNQSGTSYEPGELDYSKSYYWQIIAWDNHGASSAAPIWSFTTQGAPSPPPSPPSPPTADANGPYAGFVGVPVNFDGSDSSGSSSYSWDFGDNTTGTGVSTAHTYAAIGNYTVNLTVTGPGGSDTDQTWVVISEVPNTPPTAPVLSGPQEGHKNTSYNYTAVSTDADNDTIQYIFDWDDDTNTTTDFVANGTSLTETHNWSTWGFYNISVKAYDNKTESESTKYIVLIDVKWVQDIGYLIDTDSDDTYDLFHSNETGNETAVELLTNGSYLINSDTDDEWDYYYDPETDTLTPYTPEEEAEDYTIWYVLIIGLILVIILLLVIAAATKKKKEKKKQKKKK